MKTKIVSIFLLLWMTRNAYAEALICQEDPRDVRVELYLTPEKVKLFVMSPLGYAQLRFLDIPVSASMMSQLQYQSEQLKSLGDQFWVEWKASDCRYKIESPLKETMLECGKAEKSSSDKVDFLSFAIATLSESSFAGSTNSLRFRMTTAVEGKWGWDSFFVSIPLDQRACRVFKNDSRSKSVDKQKKKTPQ